jgi:cyclopropane fatty-acyl-phospholipid synthase-like methyltransferase
VNPFSQALQDFHAGDSTVAFVIRRDDGFEQRVPASVFFEEDTFSTLESRALELCQGRTLDVGAAAGRHSLALQRHGFDVTSLDILPEMAAVLHDRGVKRILTADIFNFAAERFDTVLMLMNGIGMVGTPDGLDRFLRHAHEIIAPSGQILCDSIDVSVTSNEVHRAHRQRNIESGRPPGQQSFAITYGGTTGEPFDWLHVDFETLSGHCARANWRAELIEAGPDGHYLCRLTAT